MLTKEQLESYDHILVMFSGGKDSIGCLIDLLERGAPKAKLELWHHDVDGREGSNMMDWPCTRDYCRKFAGAFGIPIYFSWKVGGFEREMWRKDAPTAPTAFETPEGLKYIGGQGPTNTRCQFPQVSADLSVRWCSAYLKIDVAAAAIRNQARFMNKRVLVVTGERAEESTARAKYLVFEQHRSDLSEGKRGKRVVDQWRPVHGWDEAKVWQALQRWGINPHPAYRLGWGRVSCASCIFANPDQWASLREVNPRQFNYVAATEQRTGKTIQRKLNVIQQADKGVAYIMDQADIKAALSETFDEPIMLSSEQWKLPRGAFGDSCGPT